MRAQMGMSGSSQNSPFTGGPRHVRSWGSSGRNRCILGHSPSDVWSRRSTGRAVKPPRTASFSQESTFVPVCGLKILIWLQGGWSSSLLLDAIISMSYRPSRRAKKFQGPNRDHGAAFRATNSTHARHLTPRPRAPPGSLSAGAPEARAGPPRPTHRHGTCQGRPADRRPADFTCQHGVSIV